MIVARSEGALIYAWYILASEISYDWLKVKLAG